MSSRKIFGLLCYAMVIAGCGSVLGKPEAKYKSADDGDIPSDPNAAPPSIVKGDLKPSFSFLHATGNRIALNLLGMVDAKTSQPVEFKANESVFVVEDGRLQGILVTQNAQSNSLPVDLVFTVDNSGSMSEEADGVADKMIAFANHLASSGIDVRLAVVGFDGLITGGMDFSTAGDVSAYLSRENIKGTYRTVGFEGAKAKDLERAAGQINVATGFYSGSENHVAPLIFAEKSFSWRPNAQRVFFTFTDETNTETNPGKHKAWNGVTDYSIANFCKNWQPSFGTVHTIWSDYAYSSQGSANGYDAEDPRNLATCSGGTVTQIKSDASDLNLTNVNSTVAVANSAMVEFYSDNNNATHTIDVIVKTDDGSDGITTLNLSYK